MNRHSIRPSIRFFDRLLGISILVAVLMAIGCTEQTSSTPSTDSHSRPAFLDELAQLEAGEIPLPPGERMPEMSAEGWLHGEPPSAGELVGKVVVVEVWAFW